MNITNNDDRFVGSYNIVYDNEIDIDAPYIDFNFVSNTQEIKVPENGVYDTLFYDGRKLLTVGEVSEIEIRFYTTPTPNENYRVGQRHIKGKVLELTKIEDQEEQYAGYKLSFDTSLEWRGKKSIVTVNREYIEKTQTRCIAILYFNDKGGVVDEFCISVEDWFSTKVYINSTFIVEDEEDDVLFPFAIDDLVECTVYIQDPENPKDENGKILVTKRDYIGRIDSMKLTARSYDEINENDLEIPKVVYYYLITLDISKQYSYEKVTIASTVIESMKTYNRLEPEI